MKKFTSMASVALLATIGFAANAQSIGTPHVVSPDNPYLIDVPTLQIVWLQQDGIPVENLSFKDNVSKSINFSLNGSDYSVDAEIVDIDYDADGNGPANYSNACLQVTPQALIEAGCEIEYLGKAISGTYAYSIPAGLVGTETASNEKLDYNFTVYPISPYTLTTDPTSSKHRAMVYTPEELSPVIFTCVNNASVAPTGISKDISVSVNDMKGELIKMLSGANDSTLNIDNGGVVFNGTENFQINLGGKGFPMPGDEGVMIDGRQSLPTDTLLYEVIIPKYFVCIGGNFIIGGNYVYLFYVSKSLSVEEPAPSEGVKVSFEFTGIGLTDEAYTYVTLSNPDDNTPIVLTSNEFVYNYTTPVSTLVLSLNDPKEYEMTITNEGLENGEGYVEIEEDMTTGSFYLYFGDYPEEINALPPFVVEISPAGLTGVGAIEKDNQYRVYNMQGMKVMEGSNLDGLSKGMYIINGKKIVIR